MTITYKNGEKKYINIKQVLKEEFNMSDRFILKLKKNKRIYLNNQLASIDCSLCNNDILQLFLDFNENNDNIIPTQLDLNIIYEDDYFLVLNKPPNIATHPSMLHYNDTLSNGVKYYFDSIKLKRKIRPVNRLDKDTSGVIIFAKSDYIQECLVRQMKNDIFRKEYIALCEGVFKDSSGIINAPIARKPNSIIERCVSFSGSPAVTQYAVIKTFDNISVVKCLLRTGRTHQIRVHLSHIGHPILGDTLYGSPSNLINRQALHAYRIHLLHPITKQLVQYTADIPKDIGSIYNISMYI